MQLSGSARKTVVVAVALGVGALHFVTGPQYAGPWPAFVNGYLIDILLPLSLYLLTGMIEKPWVTSRLRSIAVLAAGAGVETLQYFGYHVLGSTFDPYDYLAYAAGVIGGIVLEALLFGGPARSPGQGLGEN